MTDLSFVPGWAIGILLVCILILMVMWLAAIVAEDDAWMLEKYGPHTEDDEDDEPEHPGYCDALFYKHGMQYTCDMDIDHGGDHFDVFAKYAWSNN